MALRYLGLVCCILYALVASTVKAASCSASSATPIALIIANVTLASQNTSTFGVRFDVGDPKQNVCLTPSTVVDNTLLVSTNICASAQLENMTQAQCLSYHGGTFDLASAGASFHNISVTAASLPADLGWSKFNPSYSVAGATDVDLVSDVTVPNMTIVVITEGTNFAAGHIGLGKESVLLNQLTNSNAIPSLGFGLNAGSQSIQNPRDGSLVLGGFDAASVASSFYSYPMNYSDTLAGRHCPLQVYIESLQLLLDGVEEPVELLGEGDGHRACIEPYDNLFRLSRVGLESFQRATSWSASTTYDADELFVAEPGLMYPSKTGFNGSLRYVLENGFTVEIPNSELQHPLGGLDGNGSHLLQPNVTEINIYGEPLGAWVLGKVFLSRVYLAVDYDAGEIRVAEVTQNEVTPAPAKFASVDKACKVSVLGAGTIAAIVLGSVIGLALIGRLAYCFFRRRRRQTARHAVDAPKDTELQDYPIPVAEPAITDRNQLQREITAGDTSRPPPQVTQGADNPLVPEMSGDRRTFELETPNCGYPPPSPHAHVLSPLDIVSSPHDDDWRRTMGPAEVGPLTRAPCNNPCCH